MIVYVCELEGHAGRGDKAVHRVHTRIRISLPFHVLIPKMRHDQYAFYKPRLFIRINRRAAQKPQISSLSLRAKYDNTIHYTNCNLTTFTSI